MLCCGVKTGDFLCLNNWVMLIRSCAQPLHLGLKLLAHYVLRCNLFIWLYLIWTVKLLAICCALYMFLSFNILSLASFPQKKKAGDVAVSHGLSVLSLT